MMFASAAAAPFMTSAIELPGHPARFHWQMIS